MSKLDLIVHSCPVAQPRVKAARVGGFIRMYTPNTADAWKTAVKQAVFDVSHGKVMFDGPVRVEFTFHLPRPKKLMGAKHDGGPIPHPCKPDFDNLAKSTADAMSDVGLWNDDTQVCDARIRKFYCAKGVGPFARLVVEAI